MSHNDCISTFKRGFFAANFRNKEKMYFKCSPSVLVHSGVKLVGCSFSTIIFALNVFNII